jgi:glycosyltransferase involved in cell wall biosynthesis
MKLLSHMVEEVLPGLAGSGAQPRDSAPAHDTARDSRKTVLHLTPSIGGGGAEAMLGNLVSAMNPAKWRTVIVVIDGRRWPDVVAKLRAGGAEVHDLQSSALLRPLLLWRVIKLLRQIKPDIVQTWMHHADFVGGWCARLAGVRHIIWGIHCREIHRNPGDGDKKIAWFRRALSWSARLVPQRIVSCSSAAMEDHAAVGYPRRKMTWVPNGIDTVRFMPDAEARGAARHDLRLPARAPVIGYLGRFHEMKDLATWLKAAALLQARMPETHFLLCGGGEMELGDCARAALSLMPRRHQVHITGFHTDVERLYPALDVFSLSSRTEACPMTLMEALSCGVPCVATDVGDCGRLLEGLGQIVPPRDPEALARAWETALAMTEADREELRRKAADRFDISVAARGYEAVYQEVVAG